MFVKLFLVLCLYFALVFSQENDQAYERDVSGEEDEEEEHEEQEQGADQNSLWRYPHPDVSTSAVFPLYPDSRLPLGKPIEIVMGMVNRGKASKTFNVTYLYGSLRYSADPRVAIQNPGDVVRPQKSVSFPFWFMPDSLLEPRDYFLVLQTEYTDEDNANYSQLFFNGTIYVVDETEYDVTSLFSYFLVFAFTVGAIVLFSKSGTQLVANTIAPTEVKKVSAVGVGSVDSWGSNAVMDQWKKKQNKGNTKK